MVFTRACSYGIVILVLLNSFGRAQSPKTDANVRVAVVNGEEIALTDVEAVLQQRPVSLTAPTASQRRQMRLEAVTALIDDLLIRQFMRDYGPKVEAADVDKQYASLEEGLKTQNKAIAAFLRESNQTEAQVRASMLLQLQLDRYVKEQTTETDLKKYYEANKEYFDKTTVRSSHIAIRLPADAPAADKEKAKQKLQALRAEIVAGKIDFAKAAKENSDCPSALKGGDIGHIFRKFQNVEEAYAKAAFAMKVGDISEVVETDFGLHLIKVTERTDGKPSTFETSIDDIRGCHAEELRLALLNRLRKKAKVEVMLP